VGLPITGEHRVGSADPAYDSACVFVGRKRMKTIGRVDIPQKPFETVLGPNEKGDSSE